MKYVVGMIRQGLERFLGWRWDTISKILFILFIVGIFFLSSRHLRNLFYCLSVSTVLLLIKEKYFSEIYKNRIFKFVLLYLVYVFFSMFWSEKQGMDFIVFNLKKIEKIFLFLIITVGLVGRDWSLFERTLKWICRGAILSALISIVKFYIFDHPFQWALRLQGIGTLDHPILGGAAYGSVFLIATFFFVFNKKAITLDRWIAFATALISLVYVLMTQSRGPLLALILSAMVVVMATRCKKDIFKLAFFIGGVVWGLNWMGFVPFSRLLKRGFSSRPDIWQEALPTAMQKFWFGYGLDGSWPPLVVAGSKFDHPHNVFLYNFLEGGIVGFSLILLVLVAAFVVVISDRKKNANSTLLALLVFAVLANMTDGTRLVSNPGCQWVYFWLPVFLVGAYWANSKKIPVPSLQTNGVDNI